MFASRTGPPAASDQDGRVASGFVEEFAPRPNSLGPVHIEVPCPG